MKQNKFIILIAALGFLLAGCPTSTINTENLSELDMYTQAEKTMRDGNYRQTIQLLEDLDQRYPYGTYSQQAQLDLIYAYYKSGELLQAQTAIDRFIKLNPTHPNIDYVYYIRGLISMAFDENLIHGLFNMDRSDRDPANARIAFKDFTNLISVYPESPYSADAQKRLIFLKNRLAKYELSVVKYYDERGAYIAVINRAKEMLVEFPDTQATKDALPLMRKAYNRLGLIDEAENISKLIAINQHEK